MKKLIIIAISLLSYINAFCQDHELVASKEECVNYLMVSLAKQYLKDGQGEAFKSKNDINRASQLRDIIKDENVSNCSNFVAVLDSMKVNNLHKGGAERLEKSKDSLECGFNKETWSKICKERLVKDTEFINRKWNDIASSGTQTSKIQSKNYDNQINSLEAKIEKLEGQENNSSNSLPIISFVLSVLSLLGVGYLYYMTIIKKVNDDKSDDDSAINRINSEIKKLKDDCEFLDKKSKRIDEELISMKSDVDSLTKSSKQTQTVQNPPKQEEKQTPAPVKQETTQTVYARTKESGILREVNELSYYTLKIKNGRADVEFSGDSLTAIKNSNQYFDGVYDIADRNGSNKIEIIKIAKAEKQADGTWKVTEKGKLKFK